MRKTLLACCLIALALTPDTHGARRRAVRKTPPADPYSLSDFYYVLRGGTLSVDAASGVLANDFEPLHRPFTAVLLTPPAHGTLTLQPNGAFTYHHDGSPGDVDGFVYRADNGVVTIVGAGVTLSVLDAAKANDDSYSTPQDTTLLASASVFENDIRHSAGIVSYGITGIEQPNLLLNTPTTRGGKVRVAGDGFFIYEPPAGFSGNDTFRYQIRNAVSTSTATVTINVTPPAPTAADDSHSVAQATQLNVAAPGVLANDTLRGAAIASYGASGSEQTSLGAPTATSAGGTVRLNADGSFRYDPAGTFSGTDTFRYTIANAGGSASATVTITVQASNAVDFTVTSPGFFFRFSGVPGDNPVLTLTRGRTYRFRVQTSSIHPFGILEAPPGSVTNNNISDGILTFAVPAGAGQYRYHCTLHEFGNDIVTIP